MAITLAEAKVGMADHIDQQIVDSFRRSSLLLDKMVFDNAISTGIGGSTLTYGYIQLQTPSTASIRALNSEYTAAEAQRVEKAAKAVVMGGSFEVDRVLQSTSGAIDELAFQAEQKIKATSNYFHNLVINGSAETDEGYVQNTFDGLRKLLSSSENNVTSAVDLSTTALMDANYGAFLDELDAFMGMLDGAPTMLLMNRDMLTRVRGCARRAGYYSHTEDAFGRPVEAYNGIPLLDMGKYYNGSAVQDVIATGANGKSAIYAVVMGLDGLHGISPTGTGVINSYMPDMNAPGAVKKGEVELVAGVVLKSALKAGVLDGVKIRPAQ